MHKIYENSSILITGGTGSFGREFTSSVTNAFPNVKRLVIYSRDEFGQVWAYHQNILMKLLEKD